MSNYSNYFQGNHPTYVENLVAGAASIDGQGAVTSFAYTGNTGDNLNITGWQFNGYVLRIGKYAIYHFDSPSTPINVLQQLTAFSIPYSPDAQPSAGNVNATTAFGSCSVVDNMNQTYAVNMTSSAVGQQKITCTFARDDNGATAVVLRGSFVVNLN